MRYLVDTAYYDGPIYLLIDSKTDELMVRSGDKDFVEIVQAVHLQYNRLCWIDTVKELKNDN